MKKNNKGFSLVELIIVIAIMAILAGALAPALIKYINKSRKSTDIQNADSLRTAVQTALSNPDAQDAAAALTFPADASANITSTSTNKFYSEIYSVVGNAALKTKYKGGSVAVGTSFWIDLNLASNTVKITAGQNGDELSPSASGAWAN